MMSDVTSPTSVFWIDLSLIFNVSTADHLPTVRLNLLLQQPSTIVSSCFTPLLSLLSPLCRIIRHAAARRSQIQRLGLKLYHRWSESPNHNKNAITAILTIYFSI
jgi:hypothetical protein